MAADRLKRLCRQNWRLGSDMLPTRSLYSINGTERVKQGGHSGCRVTTYKEVRLNGTTISKDVITTDTYNPMKKIVIRGVAGAPAM